MLKQHSVFKRLLMEAADSTPGIYPLGHHHLENSRPFAALGMRFTVDNEHTHRLASCSRVMKSGVECWLVGSTRHTYRLFPAFSSFLFKNVVIPTNRHYISSRCSTPSVE